MSHNWYIGQNIVCIKNHSKFVVKENEVYIIKSLRESFCNCDEVEIDIGVNNDYYLQYCSACGCEYKNTGTAYWLSERLFAPLDTLTDISEIKEILSQPLFQ